MKSKPKFLFDFSIKPCSLLLHYMFIPLITTFHLVLPTHDCTQFISYLLTSWVCVNNVVWSFHRAQLSLRLSRITVITQLLTVCLLCVNWNSVLLTLLIYVFFKQIVIYFDTIVWCSCKILNILLLIENVDYMNNLYRNLKCQPIGAIASMCN